MVNDIHAIFEKYITEGGYDFTSMGTRQPGKPNAISASANDTSAKIGNYGGVGKVNGAFQAGANAYTAGGGPVAGSEQAEETPIQKKIKRDIVKLHDLVSKGKYEDAVVYCHSINKALQDAHNSKKK
jgi:hypothetical protein